MTLLAAIQFRFGSRLGASTAQAWPSILIALLILLVAVGGVTIQPGPLLAGENTITVNTLSDSSPSGDGLCSLREAISNANSKSDTSGGDCFGGTGTDLIVFTVSGTITLTSALPMIENTLTIDGSLQNITIDGGGLYEVLSVDSPATVVLNNLTVADGNAAAGGGVSNLGTLTVTNSTFSKNSATVYDGGAINNQNLLTVNYCTFTDNSAASLGGAIYNSGTGTTNVTNSTFSGNTASPEGLGYGGAIDNDAGGSTTVGACTFTNNSAYFGGALYNYWAGTMTVTTSTFSRLIGFSLVNLQVSGFSLS